MDTSADPLAPRPPAPSRPFVGARNARRSSSGRPAGGGGSARSHAVGAFGERLAERRLTDAGLVVVDRNWRCELGEIDLVAVVPGRLPGRDEPEQVVVCEVKTRTTASFGPPAHQVDARKVARLRRLAVRWLEEHPDIRTRRVRVDVVGVLVPRAGAPVVRHLVGVTP